MNISEELKQEAVKLDLCKEWTDGWGNPDLDELVLKYVKGIDFCIKNDFPSLEYIKDNFKGVAEKHGVFTDDQIDLVNHKLIVLNGNTKGKIILNGFTSCDIYVRHNSKVEIEISNFAIAFIRVFDNSQVRVVNKGTNRSFIYKYTDRFNGKLDTSGDILIRDKMFSDL